jgi:predicted dehydrogenase
VSPGPPRIGFLGAGLIATFHSKMLRAGRADIVRAGVYDPDRDRAEAFAAASGCPVLADEQAVLDASDAVYVCTWTSEHPRLVAAAVAAGRHVFCEKPLATDLATAEQMLRRVNAAGVVHQVGLVLRRSPAVRLVHRLVHDPAAGAVMAAVLRDDQYIPTQGMYASTWRADRGRAGAGTLLEHSIHDIDVLHLLLGPISTVTARSANHHGHDGIEDVVVATVQHRDGALATLTSVWHDNLARPSLRRLEVLCARRHVVLDGDDWFGPVRWTDADGGGGELAGEALAQHGADLDDPEELGANPDVAFVRAVAEGAPAHPDLAVAVEAHRVVDAMYRSAATGGAAVEVAA